MLKTETEKPFDVLAPAGVFVAVAFVTSGVLGAAQAVTPIPGEVIQLTQFGPALAVGAVALLWPRLARPALAGAGGRAGKLDGYGLLLLATAPLIVALCAGGYGLLTGDAQFTGPETLSSPFALIVVAQLIGACAEEIGWRCLLQPLLRRRFGPLAVPIVVGLLWGLWHVPMFGRPPAYAAAFLVATVSISVVMGLALERVRSHRLLLTGGFHTLINLGLLLFMDEESGAVVPMALFGASCLLAALLWAWKAPVRIHLR
ncbi:CPBP family intramembrane glutamic endopeptidase [Streptosporangium roseum]|uniref:CPBP family intramembrane glutamic endopeptidase n=1 Tax=Streptosporangium roseum TaxID=2001 RepID=UPI00068CC1BD|nr:CPBP family intramembrane glutamic endopeptidase [Streptosporangium roseum]